MDYRSVTTKMWYCLKTTIFFKIQKDIVINWNRFLLNMSSTNLFYFSRILTCLLKSFCFSNSLVTSTEREIEATIWITSSNEGLTCSFDNSFITLSLSLSLFTFFGSKGRGKMTDCASGTLSDKDVWSRSEKNLRIMRRRLIHLKSRSLFIASSDIID